MFFIFRNVNPFSILCPLSAESNVYFTLSHFFFFFCDKRMHFTTENFFLEETCDRNNQEL